MLYNLAKKMQWSAIIRMNPGRLRWIGTLIVVLDVSRTEQLFQAT